MKKYEDWPKGASLTDWVYPGDEIDEEMYYYFLEVVPPAKMIYGCFAVGEPRRHNFNNEPVYDCFQMSGDKYSYMGPLTIKGLARILDHKGE